MDIIEGNKIIALLVGSSCTNTDVGLFRFYYTNTKSPVEKQYNFYQEELKYHSSWDWLIPAHNKARELFLKLPKEIQIDFLGSGKTYIERHGFNNFFTTFENQYTISSCWHKMVDFAMWYNSLEINNVNI